MTTIEINRSGLLASIREWATEKDGVRALVQTGSLVRRDGLADEFSDLDIEIVTRDPASLIESDAWVHEIGSPITILHLEAEDGQEWSTRLVIFEGGIKVDFTLAGLRRLESMSGANGLDPLYERGYSILLDKDGLTKGLPAPSFAAPVRPFPSESHFRERIEEFWFEAFHVPRYLARGELYQVKQRDWTMKELLLEMMEWHALARSGGSVDVWHIGKGIRSWTDSATWTELQETFSHFDAEDARRAHNATTRFTAVLPETWRAWRDGPIPIRSKNLSPHSTQPNKNGVKLLSITQEMGDDPMHVMMRQIMALFDEYQSKENAKHVLRAHDVFSTPCAAYFSGIHFGANRISGPLMAGL